MRPTLEERTQRTLRKMLPGSFAGRSEQISPVRAPAQLSTYRLPDAKVTLTFSGGPDIIVSSSGYDHLRESLTLFAVVVLLDATVASGTYTVQMLKNPVGRGGDSVLTPTGAGSPNLSITSGMEDTWQFDEAFTGSELSTAADLLRVGITAVGTGASLITVKALFA